MVGTCRCIVRNQKDNLIIEHYTYGNRNILSNEIVINNWNGKGKIDY